MAICTLAHNKQIALKTVVAKPLPIGVGDEQRLTKPSSLK
jgi:hypothetical protein